MLDTEERISWFRARYVPDDESATGLRSIRTGASVGYAEKKKNSTVPYWFMEARGKVVRVHRVIVALRDGPLPDSVQIDHRDGDGLNNKSANLRRADAKMNGRNQGRSVRNTTGHLGVSLDRHNHCAVASWVDETGRLCQKRFSVKAHGEKEAIYFAATFRIGMIAELCAKGQGYTERHFALSEALTNFGA